MTAILTLQTVAIIAFLIYTAYKWLDKLRNDNARMVGDIAILEGENLNLTNRLTQTEIQLHKADALQNVQHAVQKDLIEGYKAQGMNLGFQQVFPEMHRYHSGQVETVKELFQTHLLQLTEGERAKVAAENQALNYRTIQSNYDQLLTKFNRLSAIVEQLEADRDKYKTERDTLETEVRSLRKAVKKESEGPFSGVVKPFTIVSDRAEKPGEDGLPTPYTRENLEFYDLKGDKNYDLREILTERGYWGQIEVVRIADGKQVGTFQTGSLQRGLVHVVEGTDIKVILCALDSCYNIRITQQVTTKCCCREHTNEVNNLKKIGVI